MILLLSTCSRDVILSLISAAVHQKLKQSAENFVTCGSYSQSTRTMYSEYF